MCKDRRCSFGSVGVEATKSLLDNIQNSMYVDCEVKVTRAHGSDSMLIDCHETSWSFWTCADKSGKVLKI